MSSADFSNKTIKQQMTPSTGKLNLKTAETERVKITAEQQKQIQKLYSDAAKAIAKEAKKAPRVPSDALRKQYLNSLEKQVDNNLTKIGQELEGTITGNMNSVASAVVDDNLKFLDKVGMPIEGAFSRVPDEVVRSVTTGQLYEGNWTLSRAIWKNTKNTQRDVQNVIAQGIVQNKSAYDIAKDLEKYVDPKARKDWEWSKVYPGTARKVDYSAQRLARTMVSHAYQQSFVKTTQNNPFVTKYRWLSSGGERMCELCADRDGREFSKDDLPLDHPNGMCTFEAIIEDSMVDISDRIADWIEGNEDSALDKWANDLGVQVTGMLEKHMTPEEIQNQLLTQQQSSVESLGKSFTANMTEYEKDSIYQYTSDGYEPMNRYLRTKQLDDPYVKKVTEATQAALSKCKLPTDMAVMRATDFSELLAFAPTHLGYTAAELRNLSAAQLDDMLAGTMAKYDAFISTSYNPSGGGDAFEASPVHLLISLPKGIEACPIETLSEYPDEKEILVNSGYSARIMQVTETEDEWGTRRITAYMELLPKN